MSEYRIDEHSVSDTDVLGALLVIALCIIAFAAVVIL